MTLLISINAIVLPGHVFFPPPKTMSTVLTILLNLASSASPSPSNHLSGLKTPTSSPNTSLCPIIPTILTASSVPPGNHFPITVSPPSGTTLVISPVAGGYRLSASRTTAWR